LRNDNNNNSREIGGRWPSWLSVRVGGKLNDHGGIVHGGVLSLLFNEAMGWAYECLHLCSRDENRINGPSPPVTTTAAVTANLTVKSSLGSYHATINPNNFVSNSASSSNLSKSSWTSNF
jgi:hypothetical protein